MTEMEDKALEQAWLSGGGRTDVAAFSWRNLIADWKDLLKWFWSTLWKMLLGVVNTLQVAEENLKMYVKAGWHRRGPSYENYGLYVHPKKGWFLVVPGLTRTDNE